MLENQAVIAKALLLLSLLSTWYMVGLIWMVQIVHYAMFDRVGTDAFTQYARDHSRLITPIVMIPMLIELASAAGLLFVSPSGIWRGWWWIAFALVAVNWLSTAFLQVPCHARLASGFDLDVHARLVMTNWIRTIGWSLRGGLMAFLLWEMTSGAGEFRTGATIAE